MTQLIRSLAVVLAALLCTGPVRAAVPDQEAPAFTLPGASGQVSLAAYRGKFVYVDFWASWCAPCKHSFPWMSELQKRYGPQLQVVAISVDTSRADAERFLTANPAGFTVAFDTTGGTPRQYAIKGMPSSVLVDPNGRVVFQHAGFTEDGAAKLEEQVRAALHSKGVQ